jgi:MHS family proline/betaine transporter-like MFS transporter
VFIEGDDVQSSTELNAARRKAVAAAGIGNFVEWFDFALYAQFATIIAAQFFPSSNPTAALLSTFAVFALGFFARPIGGVIFGHFGDKLGRKASLSAAVLLMSAATIAIGLTPAYATIGVAAPMFLVAWRVLQGLSAGGEYAGSSSFVIEYAPPGRRALFASVNPVATAMGTIGGAGVGLIVTAILSSGQVQDWGWRIPFLLAGPLGLVGLYLRSRVEETPEFEAVRRAGAKAEHAPLVEAFKMAKGRMLLLIGWAIVNAVGFYLLSGYMIAFMTQHVRLSQTEALTAYIVALLVFSVASPLAGLAADKYGPSRIAVLTAAALAVVVLPAFALMGVGTLLFAILGLSLYAVVVGGISTLTPLFMADFFPTRIRYTASAVAYNVAYAALGGTAPYVATYLVDRTGNGAAPGYYVLVIAVVGVLVALFGLRSVYRPGLKGDSQPAPAMADDGSKVTA